MLLGLASAAACRETNVTGAAHLILWYDISMKRRIRTEKRRPEPERGKRRVTMSLSSESLTFLEHMRSETRSPSMSALVERILADLRGKAEVENIDSELRAHYDSLGEVARQEERDWGAIGESGLASLPEPEESAEPHAAGER